MRGMARRVNDFDFARAERKHFAAFEDAQILRWNGKTLSEQPLQIVRPEALGAGQQLGRINHVRRAKFVDIHGEAGIFSDQRAGSASVVQVNVREKNGIKIAHTNAMGVKILPKSFERGARAGVHDGAVAVRFEKRGSNSVRATGPEVVERGDRVHSERLV